MIVATVRKLAGQRSVLPVAALLLAATCLCLTAAGCGSETGKVAVTPSHVAFGDLIFGAVENREIRIRNDTGREIVIVGSDTSCSCLKVEARFPPVPAGGEVTYKFQLDTRTLPGPTSLEGKRIIWKTNDPENEHLVLTVSGDVKALAEPTVPHVDFGRITGKETGDRARTLRIVPLPGYRLRVDPNRGRPPGRQFTHEKAFEVALAAAEDGAVDVTITPRKEPDLAGVPIGRRHAGSLRVYLLADPPGGGDPIPLAAGVRLEMVWDPQ